MAEQYFGIPMQWLSDDLCLLVGQAMRDRAMTGKALAGIIDVSEQYISDIARGRRVPTTRVLRLMAEALGGDLDRWMLARIHEADSGLWHWLTFEWERRRP